MATPPQSARTGSQGDTRSPPKNGKNWLTYGIVAVIALVVIVFLFGGIGGRDEAVTTNPVIGEAPATLPTDDTALTNDAVTPPAEAAPLDSARPGTGPNATETTPDAQASDSPAAPVIELDGSAEVEVLDDT